MKTHLATSPTLHETLNSKAAKLPAEFQELLALLPANVDRRTGAALITKHLFPVSHRSLEVWPLPSRFVNGRAVVPTAKLFEIAFAKLNAAPVVMGGRSGPSEQRAS